MKTTEELNKTMKTFPCTVTFTFGSFVNTLTVTSPKTGRTIAVKEGQFYSSAEMLEVVGIVVKALPQGGKTQVALTVDNLKAVLKAEQEVLTGYRALNRDCDDEFLLLTNS